MRTIVYLAILAPLLACNLNVEPEEQTVWETRLFPSQSGSLVSGRAAAVSRSPGTEVSLSLSELEPNIAYSWHIRGSTCEEPGPVIGSPDEYPEIMIGAEANRVASIDAFLQDRLADGGEYQVSVMISAEPEVVLACGDLIQW